MLNKYFAKKTAVFVILFFSFFMFQSTFSYADSEDVLKKAKKYINDGLLNDAIAELNRVIKKLKNIDEKRKNVAEAYYLLAKVHFDGGDEKKFEENIKMVYKVYPSFIINEQNFEIKEKVENIKNSMNLKTQAEKKKVAEKNFQKQKNELDKVEQKVIIKEGKKKKKKFPIILVAAGLAAIGVIVYFLIKPKSEEYIYTLSVTIGEGVIGTPRTGSTTYTYKGGNTAPSVSYNYTLQDGYENLILSLDGQSVASSGSIVMNRNHTLIVSAGEINLAQVVIK